jgi:endonuclease/exonuclease/phosphatase family metal-dependent hydrolase
VSNYSTTLLGIVACSLLGVSLSAAQMRTNVLVDEDDPRGGPELVICSQNLDNYGVFGLVRQKVSGATEESQAAKEAALVKRFAETKCDVIAVQEVLARDEVEAETILKGLALRLQHRTNRFFEVKGGASRDGVLHVGFLVARDRAYISDYLSYAKVELPKINPAQRPRFFSRGPLEIQIEVKGRGESLRRMVALINFHLKSRVGRDPAGLEWETYRMEEAEAIRRIVENRHARAFASPETILVLLGDRNDNFDVASARILQGMLSLRNFQDKGPCRLSKRGVPLCLQGTSTGERLFSPLLLDPRTKLRPGTFEAKGVYSWLDDILLPQESLRYAFATADATNEYDTGVVYEPKEASDHALVYVKLNW